MGRGAGRRNRLHYAYKPWRVACACILCTRALQDTAPPNPGSPVVYDACGTNKEAVNDGSRKKKKLAHLVASLSTRAAAPTKKLATLSMELASQCKEERGKGLANLQARIRLRLGMQLAWPVNTANGRSTSCCVLQLQLQPDGAALHAHAVQTGRSHSVGAVLPVRAEGHQAATS